MRCCKYVIALLLSCCIFQAQANEIRIAAAANLRYVLPELVERFQDLTGDQVSVTYAASGTLTTQILHGAPFELFLSANSDYIQRLVKAALTEGKVINYAQAQLALFSSHQSKLVLDDSLDCLKVALEHGNLKKVAIANPRHAPYGQAAEKVLRNAGIWKQIQPHLLIAENASQVAQFSLSTAADAGFVPYAHVIQPQLSSLGRFIKLDAVLQQQAVLLRGASQQARHFLTFIQTIDVIDIFTKHGFIVSAEVKK
ncbi:MAG: molybdate ABC transporter substrate-binding protein [Gammaproteobacteria bacterium]|nr:molybdate ABC transporter substrate-binding protein [Gammaproteobacteria bacterium]MDH5591327.1 molybdate ABC transporter substrate-binding protein [Gammaproteobacteria bacterium]